MVIGLFAFATGPPSMSVDQVSRRYDRFSDGYFDFDTDSGIPPLYQVVGTIVALVISGLMVISNSVSVSTLVTARATSRLCK